jgi:isopentenyl diphosphate isomerase/L-lactate dehydrogenase-like FMN-dependent dehydrogenase
VSWLKLINRLRENEAAFDHYKIRPRVLVNVNEIDTSATIFGNKVCVTGSEFSSGEN